MADYDIIKELKSAELAPSDPFTLFGAWFKDAEQAEPNDPNAMSLATVDAQGRPSLRMVLLKSWDEKGFVFYTNMESRKGGELRANPHVAVNFHWKTLNRAVRIEGAVTPVTKEEADAYYETRSRGSRIGAWASQQSRPLESRSALAASVADFEQKFTDTRHIPRPPYWTGNRIVPQRIEFWHDGAHRLHTRLTYTRSTDGTWTRGMLYP